MAKGDAVSDLMSMREAGGKGIATKGLFSGGGAGMLARLLKSYGAIIEAVYI